MVLTVALGKAAQIARAEAVPLREHMRATRDRLCECLIQGLGEDAVRVNGPVEETMRLPNTLSIGLKGLSSSVLLGTLSERLAASAGAACHSDGAHVSAVLRAMKVPAEFALGTLRLSTGRHTTMEEVERAADLIIETARTQRRQST